jgi:hypothetical protein
MVQRSAGDKAYLGSFKKKMNIAAWDGRAENWILLAHQQQRQASFVRLTIVRL